MIGRLLLNSTAAVGRLGLRSAVMEIAEDKAELSEMIRKTLDKLSSEECQYMVVSYWGDRWQEVAESALALGIPEITDGLDRPVSQLCWAPDSPAAFQIRKDVQSRLEEVQRRLTKSAGNTKWSQLHALLDLEPNWEDWGERERATKAREWNEQYGHLHGWNNLTGAVIGNRIRERIRKKKAEAIKRN